MAGSYCQQALKSHPWVNWIRLYVLDEAQREALFAVLCFAEQCQQLHQLEHTEVALQKAQWWFTELTHCQQHNAQHPITQSLQQHAPLADLTPLSTLTEAHFLSLSQPITTLTEHQRFAEQTLGNVLHLFANILMPNQLCDVNPLARSIYFCDVLNDLTPHSLTAELPDTFVEQIKCTDTLSALEHPQALWQCFAEQIDCGLQSPLKIVFLNMLRRYYQALSQQMRHDLGQIITHRFALSPLYTHWVFFKARMEAKKV